ncbi:DUF6415 family natural product biosynthesis protein [Streptomyces qinzhouensis]|uniref:Uncharacterized protein n=1 Tax=Streptomyces qinzhouensis TaxID=2599401 RepID=A0A5B8IC99_9ACTN|nr:DUF6415 family natural product biosynthesis protein [Streptomyces qinzhouensis]QDY75422.1 hypothetical protein FQU76_01650 [Streptomyces qinzhouensis]
MTGSDQGHSRRVPQRLEVERWQPPLGPGTLERLLGALRVYQPGSFDAAREVLEAVRAEGPCVTGPVMRELTVRLRKQLEELVPVLRERVRAGPRRRDLRAIRRAEHLLRAGEALTMPQARRQLDDLMDVTQDILWCLAVNAVPADRPARTGPAPPAAARARLAGAALGMASLAS